MSHQAHQMEAPILYTKSVRLAKSNGSDPAETPEIILWAGLGGLFVSADLRGVASDDLQIHISSTSLTFSGYLRSDLPPGKGGIRQVKKAPETFSRALDLPYEVNVDDAEVQNENGLISIILKRMDSRQYKDCVAQSSFTNSMKCIFGEDGESSNNLKDEIMILETLERYLECHSGKGFAR